MDLSAKEYQHLVQEIARETGAKRDGTGKNLIVPRCPSVASRGGKFGIYIGPETARREPFMAHCFSCGKSTRTLGQLLEATGRMDLMVTPTADITAPLQFVLGVEPEEIDDMLTVTELPDFYKRTFSHPYLKERGFTYDDYDYFPVGVTNRLNPRFEDYVIFPIIDNGENVGFVGRHTWSKSDIDAYNRKVKYNGGFKILRYRNSVNNDFSKLLYNYDAIHEDETDTVILVEGIFDVIALTRKMELYDNPRVAVVATFGKKISDVQVYKLQCKRVQTVIVGYDGDAVEPVKKAASRLAKYFNVFVANIADAHKDWDEMSVEEIFDIFVQRLQSPLKLQTTKGSRVMMQELIQWLDAQNIDYTTIDNEVVEIPNFGKMFLADLSGVESIFKSKDGDVRFNLMENQQELQDEGIFYVAFAFGNNWYYYDLREEFRFNILKHIGKPKSPKHNISFVNLGVHTPFELLNASGSIDGLCRKAKWLGQTAVGICDRNTMAATLNLQKECVKAGLKPVFGYTLTMLHNETKVEIKIYALSNKGLHNLLNIQREVMVNSEDGVIEYSRLFLYAEGCAIVFATRSAYWITENPRHIERMKERFDAVYYQVDGNEYKADRIDREKLAALKHYFENCYDAVNDSFSVEPILIADSYYIDRDDAKSKIVLNKIATGAAHEQSEEQYFKSVDEHYNTLQPLFSEKWDFDRLFERMCRHTVDIAERADAAFETGKMFMPEYMMRPEEQERYGDRRTMFLRLLDEGLSEKIPEAKHQIYRERLDEEVYIIESTDNVDYFLVQWDMVREAKRRGIATGIGRGSAGGSLVSYLLGITSIDPIKYDLIFSRFLVPERCGLSWKDKLTVLAPDIPIQRGVKYIEVEIENTIYMLHPEAKLRIVRDGKEMTITADKLSCGDDILLDRRDCLWNLKEISNEQLRTSEPL